MPVYKHRMNHKQRAGKVKAYENKRQRDKGTPGRPGFLPFTHGDKQGQVSAGQGGRNEEGA